MSPGDHLRLAIHPDLDERWAVDFNTNDLGKARIKADNWSGDYSPRTSKTATFVEAVAEMNVQLTMQKLRDRSVVLHEILNRSPSTRLMG